MQFFCVNALILIIFLILSKLMNVAVAADDGTKQEWNVDLCNCKKDQNPDLLEKFSTSSRELINNFNNKEQQWKSEQKELLSQAAECKVSLHQLNQSCDQAATEWQTEKLDLNLKLQNKEQELTKLQQKMQDQFIKYETLLEEIETSIIKKTSYKRITAICKAVQNAKCVTVRCYDLKLAQDMKAHNTLTAIAMYDDLITKLTPCLDVPNLQQLMDEKANLQRKLKNLEKLLFDAAKNGNGQLLRILIANGVNINATDKSKNSGLIIASWYQQPSIVKLLIEEGAFLDTQNIHNQTALILAARFNRTDICKMLLDAGANVNIQNSNGFSALAIATVKYNLNLVNLLMERGAEVDIATNEGNTPLHAAAKFGYVDIAKILVEHGANLNSANNEGKTPIGHALFYNQAQMVTYLMSIGATE